MERNLNPRTRDPRLVARYGRTSSRRPSVVAPQRQAQTHEGTIKHVAPIKSFATPHTARTQPTGTYFEIKTASTPPKRPRVQHVDRPAIKPNVVTQHGTETAHQPSVDQNAPELSKQRLSAPRETVKREKTKLVRSRKRFYLWKPQMLQAMAAMLFIFGLYVSIDSWLVNRVASEQAQVLASRFDDDSADDEVLSEEKPAEASTYTVAPDLPRIMEIPSIDVSTRVLQLGVNADNSLAAPKNIHDAGWYTGSAKPTATTGAMLIDGHVSGPTRHGVFYDLKKLKPGNDIVIERGDRQRQTFAVTRVKTVPVESVDMNEMMRSDDSSKLGLNLITCGGQFDAASNSFKSRVLVFAVLK